LIPKRQCKITIAVPASIVAEQKGLREKTEIVGRIARSMAIFRVEEVIIYPDEPNESQLLKLLFGYAETPQYLRKYVYKIRPELQYVGVIRPLRTPNHPLGNKISDVGIDEFREGVLLEVPGKGLRVDIGIDQMLKIVGKTPSIGSRITVKIMQTTPELQGIAAKLNEIPEYWGYQIQVTRKNLGDVVMSEVYDLAIATSRTGNSISMEYLRLQEQWTKAKNALIAFGSPREGLREILNKEGKNLDDIFGFNLNTIPNQGCSTVRTEEALQATLSILNLFG